MTDSIRILSFHADPGHGWLAAPIDEIRKAKLSISGYSYVNQDEGMAYLEEDCDAMVFINHLKKNDVPFTISETHINDDHPIRSYESWPEEWNPKSEFSVSLTLERDNDMREHDESWFDVENIRTELRVWLEDLDFAVSNITINKTANG
ncbi:MAG: hypothetical protein VYE62_09495 [Pseudomonadota bacterium]|nr:hypothetical protein [Pseudomonadota bacterium]|tara:strand:- start:938 stop:1384 length:447 start_codon:yes stop_codon:yes gene_type:complete